MKPRTRAKQKKEKVGAVGVKIYSHMTKGYPAWEVADFSSGRRVLRSFSEFDKAKEEAERIRNLPTRADRMEFLPTTALEVWIWHRAKEHTP